MKERPLRINSISKHVKDRGEVVYMISPLKEFMGTPIIPEREERGLYHEFLSIREKTMRLIRPLSFEDCVVADPLRVKSVKWYLAYTSYLFETSVLQKLSHSYKLFSSFIEPLFREETATFSRPTFTEVLDYRKYVDQHMEELLYRLSDDEGVIKEAVLFAIHQEAFLQEKLLSDLKYSFFQNKLYPIYQEIKAPKGREGNQREEWLSFEPGLYNIGHAEETFAFKNERPLHVIFLHPFSLSKYLVRNQDYLLFMKEGGYEKEEFWLEEGWQWLQKTKRKAPYYWVLTDAIWSLYTLSGIRELDLKEPVSHVTYYEADAYARWARARLPTEVEWEVAAHNQPLLEGNFLGNALFHPTASFSQKESEFAAQLFGDVWEWTSSSYALYPGNHSEESAFRQDHKTLRGGSALFDQTYFRKTLRRHQAPSEHTLLSGIRLAKDR